MGVGGRFFSSAYIASGLLLLLQAVSPVGAAAEGLSWMRTYNGAASRYDYGYGVAAAADGSVYVTGRTDVAGQGENLLLQKYSPAGALLWTRTYNGAVNGDDTGWGVAVAADGSVYVTGMTGYVTAGTNVVGQDANLLLQKYSPAGALLWMRAYNGADDYTDIGYGVAVAADGSVYVVGMTETVGRSNVLLRKYSPSGALLWMRTYIGASYHNYGHGVAVAADGSVYVTGRTFVPNEYENLLLQKYSPTGALLWTRTYNGVAGKTDHGLGVAVAADGSVYVTGRTGTASKYYDLLLRKYSPAGRLLWAKQYDGAGKYLDGGTGVAVAADGSVYVSGRTVVTWPSNRGMMMDLLLQKYSPAGALLWTKTFDGWASFEDEGAGVAVSADGGVCVIGSTLAPPQYFNLLLLKYQ